MTANGFKVTPKDDTTVLGSAVVHPPQDPESSLAYNLVAYHIKTPSEHSIMYEHYAVEIQFEHKLDWTKSYIRPQLKNSVAHKMYTAVLIEVGMKNLWLQNILNAIPLDGEYDSNFNVPKQGYEDKKDLSEVGEGEGMAPFKDIHQMYSYGTDFVPEQAME